MTQFRAATSVLLPMKRLLLLLLLAQDDSTQSRIDALKVPAVAWRQIQWKTCLLDGIRASREQKKPLILWVFIDRPVDDERC